MAGPNAQPKLGNPHLYSFAALPLTDGVAFRQTLRLIRRAGWSQTFLGELIRHPGALQIGLGRDFFGLTEQ